MCKVEFQDVLVRRLWHRYWWVEWIGKCCSLGAVWAEYQVEAVSCKASLEVD